VYSLCIQRSMYDLSMYTLSLPPCGIQKNPGFTVPHLVETLVMQISYFLMKCVSSTFFIHTSLRCIV
jgi:hypothetical protein